MSCGGFGVGVRVTDFSDTERGAEKGVEGSLLNIEITDS